MSHNILPFLNRFLKPQYVCLIFLLQSSLIAVNACSTDEDRPSQNSKLPYKNALLSKEKHSGCKQRAIDTKPNFAVPLSDDPSIPGWGPFRQTERYLNRWLERRNSWQGKEQQYQNSIVFVGDSITQMWESRQQQAFPNLKIANRGIGSDTSRGVLFRLKDDVVSLNPKGVVLLIGTNDIEDGISPDLTTKNIGKILEELIRHNPHMPILLCEVLPSSPTKKRPSQTVQSLNKQLFELAKKHSTVTIGEIWSLFATEEGNARSDYFIDLIHPNKLGYTILENYVGPLVSEW